MPRWPPISGSGKKPVLIQKQTIGYSPARTRAGNIPSGQILSCRKSFVRQRSERESPSDSGGTHFATPTPRSSGQRRECEGGAGTDAARQQSSNTRGLFAGAEYGEAASSRTGCPDDHSCAAGGCGTRKFLRRSATQCQLGRRNHTIWKHRQNNFNNLRP